MKETNKTSKLIFDMKLVRKLLKMNGELKFCPYCGKSLTDKCECHKNIIVDVKPLRGSEEATIAVFANNESFQLDLTQIMDEIKTKKETESEPEQLVMDLD
jgi:hypothetical protein